MRLVLVATRRNFAGGGRSDGGDDLDNGGYGGSKPSTWRRDGIIISVMFVLSHVSRIFLLECSPSPSAVGPTSKCCLT